ncbi:MAG: glycosyltransferase [Myxococcota bacterium]
MSRGTRTGRAEIAPGDAKGRSSTKQDQRRREALMLLDNECAPDLRVQREAMSLARHGWRVRVLCWDREGQLPEHEESKGGITLTRIRTLARRQLGLRQLTNLCRFYAQVWERREQLVSADTSVIHAHDLLMLPLAGALKNWLGPRARLVYDAHEIFVKMEAHRYPFLMLHLVDRAERWLVNRYANAFITVSHQRVRDWWGSRIVRPGVFVCGNWFDPRPIDPGVRQAMRKRLNISEGTFVVGYLGSLNANRRVDLLLDAIEGREDMAALIGGRGDRRSSIERRIALMPNARFLGWVEDPWPVYESCDALYYLVDPDHPYARFNAPNNANIALAMRLPLVTGAEGESAEIVRQTGLGRIVEPSPSAIRRALLELSGSSSSLPREEEDAVSRLQAQWSWQEASRALLSAYGEECPSTPLD